MWINKNLVHQVGDQTKVIPRCTVNQPSRSTVKCRCSSVNCRWILWRIASLTWLHLHGTGHKTVLAMLCMVEVDPSTRAFYGVGLRPFACWDCGFESRAGAWMSVCCECCVLSGRVLCDGPITRPEESYRVWCVWVWSWFSIMRRLWPTRRRCAIKKFLV